MPEENSKVVSDVLGKFESATETFLEVAVADSLRAASAQAPSSSQSERDIWWAESAAMSFYRRADGEASVWGTTYGPMTSATKEDGSPFYAPDIKEADSVTIAYWNLQRSLESKHPILRARYSDLVWDFSRVAANQKPDVSFARIAIDAYIEAAKLSYKHAVQPIHYIERAMELAISIGDEQRTQRVVDAMFDLYERVAQPELAGSWPFLFDNLLDNKKITLTEEQQKLIIRSLEEMLRRSADRCDRKSLIPGAHKERLNVWQAFIANLVPKKKFNESSEPMEWRLRSSQRRHLQLWLWRGCSRCMRHISMPE